MRILFVFLDGVGLGPADPAINPFADPSYPNLARLAGDTHWTEDAPAFGSATHVFRPIDANLNMEGLPQSGTGQASLFTGVNCAEAAGRHYGPYPHSQTRPILAEHNIFSQVQALFGDNETPAAFVNAYPPRFFEYVRRRDRWTVTTRCCLDAGLRIRTHDDLQHGDAITADITAEGWQQFVDVPHVVMSEEEAGHRFVKIGEQHAVSLFEYFLTDKAGHTESHMKARPILASLDRFFGGILASMDPAEHLLLITSDHGNLEDLSTKTHTRNPVPLIAYGRHADRFADATSILDVTPRIIDLLQDERPATITTGGRA